MKNQKASITVKDLKVRKDVKGGSTNKPSGGGKNPDGGGKNPDGSGKNPDYTLNIG